MTHLASADDDKERTSVQLDLFDSLVLGLQNVGIRPPFVHASHSAGLPSIRKTHTHARPGLLLYGLKPRPLAPPIEVRPVMSVHARIILLKDVPAGTAISYGARFVARRPSRIATLPIGYADGIPRTVKVPTYASRCGERIPIAGTVCMDFLMLDVTDLPKVAEGDEITLFGDEPSAWDLADWAGTTVWDILTRVGPRLARVYTEGGRPVAFDPPALR
jgi:alanine racemase